MHLAASEDVAIVLASLAAIGLAYGGLSGLIDRTVLAELPEHERDTHPLQKGLLGLMLFLLLADLMLIILPIFGVESVPF